MGSGNRRRLPIGALAAALGICFVVAGAALAHEGHHHDAKGTVKSITETRLELETTDGAAKSFVLSASTKYLRGKSEVEREEVAAGERAVVTYETKDGADRALEVRLAERQP
jgi:hypothetical protein